MAQAPKASTDAQASASVADLFEAHAGRLLGIPEDTPQTDEPQDQPELDEEPEAQPEPEVDADVEPAADEGDHDATPEPEPEADDEQPELFTIKVDGKEEQVTLEELKAGHQRHRDYTRKTQALAERDKALDTEFNQVRETRTNLITLLERADVALQAMAPEKEPDWADMAESMSAEEVLHAQKEYRAFTQRRKVIQDRLEAERQAEFAAAEKVAEAATAVERQRLLDAMPEWKDETKRNTGQKAVVDYALSLGFTRDQLKAASDHRLIVLLDKARRYDVLKKGTPRPGSAKGKQGVRTAVPGVSTPPRTKSIIDAKAREAARAKLAKSGSAKDAEAMFMLHNI